MTARRSQGISPPTEVDPTSEPAATWTERSSLVPWSQNPRINKEAVAEVAASIKRFGFGSPIIARKADRQVIAGHTRLEAAAMLSLEWVPVRFLDLDPADARLLALADNKLGEIASWDTDTLSDVLQELEAEGAVLDGLGWTGAELDELLAECVPELDGSEDDCPDVVETTDSTPGHVYELGPHRLVCGDATKASTWEMLMQSGQADLVWTDPPYGVSYVGKTKDALTLSNDDLDAGALAELLTNSLTCTSDHCRPGAVWYVCAPAGPLFAVFGQALSELEIWRHTLVWLKDRFVLGRCDYHYRHEAIFYGWKPGAAHDWKSGRTHDSIHEVSRPGASREHPTMKPVELIERCLTNHVTPGTGAIVADPFGGSGSTLIAAARLNCEARLIELDPRYCDVIRRRWTKWATEKGLAPGSGALGDGS